MGIVANNYTLIAQRAWNCAYPTAALYSPDTANTMITTQNYIPVASASELDALRNFTTQTMGAGTPWEGTYTTGTDKKYLQVGNIDDYFDYSGIADFSGIFDGNELSITTDRIIFALLGCTVKNVNVYAKDGELTDVPALLATVSPTTTFTGTNYVDNCHSYGNILAGSFNDVGGLLNRNGQPNDIIITNCSHTGNVTGNSSVGGIIGYSNGYVEITDCDVSGDVTGERTFYTYTGGIIGRAINSADISNITYTQNVNGVNGASRNVGGIAGQITGASSSIDNITVTGNVEGNGVLVGGAFGDINNATISNCIVNGNITGLEELGGIAGDAPGSTISQCKYDGNISGDRVIGGIVGRGEPVTIEECMSSGNYVSNNGAAITSSIGGILGFGFTGTVNNCYSTASVEGDGDYIGGLIGYNRSAGSSVENCYSIGLVTEIGTPSFVGGLIGKNDGTVTNSYWNTETSGQATSDGGTGKTTAEMQSGLIDDPDTDGIYVDWDALIWDERTTSEYPILQWETT